MKETKSSRFFFLSKNRIDEALSQITQCLEKVNLKVDLIADALEISYKDSPIFKLIYLEKDGYLRRRRVNEQEKKITQEIIRFQAKIEVSFDDLDDVLQEYSTMHFIQEVLLGNFEGRIFLEWNSNEIK